MHYTFSAKIHSSNQVIFCSRSTCHFRSTFFRRKFSSLLQVNSGQVIAIFLLLDIYKKLLQNLLPSS